MYVHCDVDPLHTRPLDTYCMSTTWYQIHLLGDEFPKKGFKARFYVIKNPFLNFDMGQT
jgi:hypothetical protein